MLSILGNTSANVGQVLGDGAKGVPKQLIIFGGKFSSAQVADAATTEATLKAASLLPKTDPGKLYLLPEVQNFEDRSEQNTTGALNLGPTVMLKEGKTSYEIKVDGTSEFAKAMRRWNNLTVGIMEYDSNRKIWGRKVGDYIQGYSAKIYVNQMRVASGQAPEEGIVTITISFLSTEEYGNNAKAIDCGLVDMTLVKSQVDAELRIAAANASNVYKLSLGVPLSEHGRYLDLIAHYGAPVAAASLFEAHTGTNFGTTLAITNVAINAAGYLDVTFDSTGYAALAAAAKIRLRGKAPSVLEAAGISDIEIAPVFLTK